MLRPVLSFAAIVMGARLLMGAPEAGPAPEAATPAPAGQSLAVKNLQNVGGAKADRTQYWFGVAVEKISPAIARQLKLHPDQGLMIFAILPDSPAARAGLKADDLLIELNGKPLVSQEELAIAANTLADAPAAKTGKEGGGARVQPSNFVFMREGDRKQVDITPAPRPGQMLVLGPDAQLFSPKNAHAANKDAANNDAASNNAAPRFTNYVAPNGTSFLVGPGYQIDLQSQSAGTVNIQKAVSNGERVILTQDTDAGGRVRNTITQGKRTYEVVPGHLQEIPENIRGLAAQMLSESNQAETAPATNSAEELARELNDERDRLKSVEMQVDRLREQIDALQHGDGAAKVK